MGRIGNFNQHFQKIRKAAANMIPLEQGISSKKHESPFSSSLTFSQEDFLLYNKKEMISQLNFIFENNPNFIFYL